MSSTIKCVSCKQRINLAPDASGIVTCPMCKTQQPVPDEQGQHAPQLPPQQTTTFEPASPTDHGGAGHQPIERGPINRNLSGQDSINRADPNRSMPPHSQHDFEPSKGGCGCLLAGLSIALFAVPLSLALIFIFA